MIYHIALTTHLDERFCTLAREDPRHHEHLSRLLLQQPSKRHDRTSLRRSQHLQHRQLLVQSIFFALVGLIDHIRPLPRQHRHAPDQSLGHRRSPTVLRRRQRPDVRHEVDTGRQLGRYTGRGPANVRARNHPRQFDRSSRCSRHELHRGNEPRQSGRGRH